MQLQFIRNIQFTRLVKAEGRLREFNFRKFRGEGNDWMFSIDVADDRGNRIIFTMKKEGEGWKIVSGKWPAWVISNESVFHELIEEELRQAS